MIADLAQRDSRTFNWLLGNFVRDTHGVQDAIAVSSDGLLIAMSDGLDRASADRSAALVSGLTSLAKSASRDYAFDGMKLVMIEMQRGFLLISAVSGDQHTDLVVPTPPRPPERWSTSNCSPPKSAVW